MSVEALKQAILAAGKEPTFKVRALLNRLSPAEIVDACEQLTAQNFEHHGDYFVWACLDAFPGGKAWSVFREQVNRMSDEELVETANSWVERRPEDLVLPPNSSRQDYLNWMSERIWD